MLIGLAFVALGWRLPMGSATQMGPGYIPIGAALILIALGAVSLLRGLASEGARPDAIVWRPVLFVPLAVLAFALSLERLGLVVAIGLTVLVGRFAIAGARPLHTLMLAAGMAALCVALFHYGFEVPAPVWPPFLQSR